MASCTFFGHRDCPSGIRTRLRETLVDLIENYGVDFFYIGSHGSFDAMARNIVRELKTVYPKIEYTVVLAYMPQGTNEYTDFTDTMLPEGIEQVPKRFAISWRNNWMLNRADYVVTYITHSWGGAAQFAQKAERQRKVICNLADRKYSALTSSGK